MVDLVFFRHAHTHTHTHTHTECINKCPFWLWRHLGKIGMPGFPGSSNELSRITSPNELVLYFNYTNLF